MAYTGPTLTTAASLPDGLAAFVSLTLNPHDVIDRPDFILLEAKTFMTAYQIDPVILNQATECECGFRCASKDSDRPRCPVEKSTGLLFVKTTYPPDCSYFRLFGSGFYCGCPARREIYFRYGV